MDLSNIQTLDDLIEFGKNGDFSLNNLGLLHKDTEYDLTYIYELVYTRYEDILRSRMFKITYNDKERRKYMYRPELLCMDVYGTPLLYHLILFLNNVGAHRFNKKYVYLLSKSDIKGILQDIIMKEEKHLKSNRNKLQD